MLRLRLKQVYDSAIEQKDNYFVKIMKNKFLSKKMMKSALIVEIRNRVITENC